MRLRIGLPRAVVKRRGQAAARRKQQCSVFLQIVRDIFHIEAPRSGPGGCAYVADYGVVRDFGQSDPEAKFKVGADAPLVQIPGTSVIWEICPVAAGEQEDKKDEES